MSNVSVLPICGNKELWEFIKFQWEIYKDNPYWVPPLLMDRRKLLDRKINPFYQHSKAEFFLARKKNTIVGRIAAIVNYNHNKEHNENIGFFGFFECVNDQETANSLFDTAKDWLRKEGMTAIRGPANPSVNDEYGLLIDGFDRSPVIMMPYNPPYYVNLIEKAGFEKAKDLFAYFLSQETVYSEKLKRVSEVVKKRENLSFRALDMKNFSKELESIKKIYNKAWQYNWGAVPMTDAEFDALAKALKMVIEPELVIIAESKGEAVGFALSLPEINLILKHNKRGRLLPALWRLFLQKKKIDGIRIIVLGVLKEYQKTGVASVLFLETAMRAKQLGYKWGEAGWVLEDNIMMNRSAEMLNASRYKTYRIYQSNL